MGGFGVLQAQVRERTKHMEALVGELNMGQAQADEQKHEVTRLQVGVDKECVHACCCFYIIGLGPRRPHVMASLLFSTQALADEPLLYIVQAELTEMKRLWLEARRRDRRAAAGKGGAARVLQTVSSNVIVEEVVEGGALAGAGGTTDFKGVENAQITGGPAKVDANSLAEALVG